MTEYEKQEEYQDNEYDEGDSDNGNRRQPRVPMRGGETMTDPQIITTATLKTNKAGGELLTFTIRLGFFQLVCIANIPEEGQDEAPVYVKFKVSTPRERT
jgi:hypothetical protein